jgi:NAD(P)-dependent dehydrogenase (short-subunit alcohol dehydrogenase family)
MSESHTNPSALIFGATGGIGSALARRLSGENWRLALSARGAERLQTLGTELSAHIESADATNPKAVENTVAAACENFGRLDGVVNCVGTILLKPAHLISDEEWRMTLDTNLTSSFLLLREAARRMMSSGGGSIVFCSTVAAQRGMFNHEAIAAAKAGVEGLTRAAAATYARYQIRVNCVAPGLVQTPLSQFLTANEAVRKASVALHPLGRLGEPGDVASAICWLLSPEQKWVTGQVLHVDGGLSTVQAR